MHKLYDKKQHKKNSLLNAAFDLFTAKGIEKTSISDITLNAKVAKGTFYLYFKSKYDIYYKLISHKSSELFGKATQAMEKEHLRSLNEKIIFLVDHIINELARNPKLLKFISKNLSWAFFKEAVTGTPDSDNFDFQGFYLTMLKEDAATIEEPEIMLYTIVELVNATCHNAILYGEPATIDTLKPFLYRDINSIIDNHKV